VRQGLQLQRTPIESREPIVAFAIIRALIIVATIAALSILGFPYGGEAALFLGALALPWALIALFVTRRSPEAGLNPVMPAIDIAALGMLLAIEPQSYGPVHFAALFMVAAHAHLQGEQFGLLIGGLAAAVIVPISLVTDVPVAENIINGYETVFAVCCLSIAIVVGSLRTAESSDRLRARALSRRTIDTETEVRRHLAEAIHDGPIQELSSVELMLASAAQAFERGDAEQGNHALSEARALTRNNITFLRDEIVELGPHAFEERHLDEAVADCVDTWQRRHRLTVSTDVTTEELPPDVAGALFRIIQEAVTNAGKHGEASNVTIRVALARGRVELEVTDDGKGFGDVDPLGPGEPGHIGLASMRERAEMFGGRLGIESGDGGTSVRVSMPI
jgi:signal transduction histidine kinase